MKHRCAWKEHIEIKTDFDVCIKITKFRWMFHRHLSKAQDFLDADIDKSSIF